MNPGPWAPPGCPRHREQLPKPRAGRAAGLAGHLPLGLEQSPTVKGPEPGARTTGELSPQHRPPPGTLHPHSTEGSNPQFLWPTGKCDHVDQTICQTLHLGQRRDRPGSNMGCLHGQMQPPRSRILHLQARKTQRPQAKFWVSAYTPIRHRVMGSLGPCTHPRKHGQGPCPCAHTPGSAGGGRAAGGPHTLGPDHCPRVSLAEGPWADPSALGPSFPVGDAFQGSFEDQSFTSTDKSPVRPGTTWPAFNKWLLLLLVMKNGPTANTEQTHTPSATNLRPNVGGKLEPRPRVHRH